MTCTHVLGLIDAGPFADYPRAHLRAAWAHARQCTTCGPALQASTALTSDLAALAQPAPPPDFAAIVLARISQIDRPRSAPASAVLPDASKSSSTRDSYAWAALGGVAGGVAIILSMTLAGGDAGDIASHTFGGMSVVAMPSTTRGALVLVAGLLLYLMGLFAPLQARSKS